MPISRLALLALNERAIASVNVHVETDFPVRHLTRAALTTLLRHTLGMPRTLFTPSTASACLIALYIDNSFPGVAIEHVLSGLGPEPRH